MQDVVKRRRRVFGSAHPDTRLAEFNLSDVRDNLDNLAKHDDWSIVAAQACARGILARRRLAAEHAAAVVLQTLARAHA